jgi:putative heme-binding domain-containing protein
MAQRLLVERNEPGTRTPLETLVLDAAAPRKTRLHALWSLVGRGELEEGFHLRLLADRDEDLREWGVRAAGNFRTVSVPIRQRIEALASDPSVRVQLQVAIAAGKIEGVDAMPLLLGVLSQAGDDKLIPHIVWQNLHPLLETGGPRLLELARSTPVEKAGPLRELMPRVLDRLLAVEDLAAESVAALLVMLGDGPLANADAARACVAVLGKRVQSGELDAVRVDQIRRRLASLLDEVFSSPRHPLATDVALLGTSWRDPRALAATRQMFLSAERPVEDRVRALDALVAARDAMVVDVALRVVSQPGANPYSLREAAVAALARLEAPQVGGALLDVYPRLEPEFQPRVIEALTGRASWSRQLLEAIAAAKIPATALNVNQVRKLLELGDSELVELIREKWGTLRTERDPHREELMAQMRELILSRPGDPHAGRQVYHKVCGQCHKIYGEGEEVGPDITRNGRASFDQLLSNVFDPSLVIGAGYQATTIVTSDGRVLSGLVTEDGPQRVSLKTQGGKIETIARANIEEQKVSQLSLMPEGFDNQLTEQ